MEHLIGYLAHAVLWRAVSVWFRAAPPAVQVGLFVIAALLVLHAGRRVHRSRWGGDR